MKLTKEQLLEIDKTLISIGEMLGVLGVDDTPSDAELLSLLQVDHETVMSVVDKLTELNKSK